MIDGINGIHLLEARVRLKEKARHFCVRFFLLSGWPNSPCLNRYILEAPEKSINHCLILTVLVALDQMSKLTVHKYD